VVSPFQWPAPAMRRAVVLARLPQPVAPQGRGRLSRGRLGRGLLGRGLLGRGRLARRQITRTRASLLSDAGATTVTLTAASLAVGSIKYLERSGTVNKLLSRKLIHTIAGPGFLAFWPLFGDTPASQLICAVTPLVNGATLFLAGSGLRADSNSISAISRSGDRSELLRGPLYYCIVLTLVTLLLWRHNLTSVVVTSVMCAGDGLADIVGRRFGQGRKLPWSQSKSVPGSAAMFGGGLAMASALTVYFGMFGLVTYDEWTFVTMAGISLAATLLESLDELISVDDNISVPLLSTCLGLWLL
jgi:phytol kinase